MLSKKLIDLLSVMSTLFLQLIIIFYILATTSKLPGASAKLLKRKQPEYFNNCRVKRPNTESGDETRGNKQNMLKNGDLFVEKTKRSGRVYTFKMKDYPKPISFNELNINQEYKAKKLVYKVSNIFKFI